MNKSGGLYANNIAYNPTDLFPQRHKSGSKLKKDLKSARKKKWWRGQRLNSKFKELDLYGEQISLTYKGENQYKTLPGAMASFLVLMTLLAFATYRMIILVTRDNPNVSNQSYMRNLDLEPPLIPADFGYDLAFGLPKVIDPTIGKYIVNRVAFDYVTDNSTGIRKRIKSRTPVNFSLCENRQFLGFNQSKVAMYGIP